MIKIEVNNKDIDRTKQYAIQRAAEYPPIADQLDALWKMIQPPAGSDAAAIKDRIEAIKAKYPKPQ